MELTKEVRTKAQELNSRIIANAQIAAESIVRVGQDLKIMRDEKLYSALGYSDFETYCKLGVKIGQRQAYNFIRCFETYGEQLAGLQHLGITKLTAMLALDSDERTELIANGDAEEMSTRDLEKRIKELQSKNEQLTLELGEKSKEKTAAELLREQNERLKAELEAAQAVQNQQKERVSLLEKQNEELSKRPVEVAVEKPSAEEITKIEEAAAEKAKKAAQKQHEEEIKKLCMEYEAEAVHLQSEAKKKNLAEIERLKSEIEALQSRAKKSPPDAKKERIKFFVEEVQRNFNAAVDCLDAFPEDERAKYSGVLAAVLGKMREVLNEN